MSLPTFTLLVADTASPFPTLPAPHVRNALQKLAFVAHNEPAFAATLGFAATRHRANLALTLLEASALAVRVAEQREAVENAIEAGLNCVLTYEDVPPWDFVDAVHQLFKAFILLSIADATICQRCGYEILADSIGGAQRGSCHCPERMPGGHGYLPH